MTFRLITRAAAVALALLLAGCSREATLGAKITGYNHTTDQSLYYYTVNGNMGSSLLPGGGGGKFSCCVEIPQRWKPGIKVKVRWIYADGAALPPEPPPHTAEIELPPYQPGDIGSVQVHFYPDQKIRVLVAKIGLGHPDYPPDLAWEAPTPPDAIAGTPLPYTLEQNPEFAAQEPGETEEQMRARVAAGQARVEARRNAKQARWDALVAAKAAGRTVDESTLPKLLPREPLYEPGIALMPPAATNDRAPAPTTGGAR
ncbi:MAG: DUF3304 domain-containing protein [Burkholderiaceae bacterium]|nr:DUF3304 domain-containing protein [Burkholderiaceae bacterium]